MAGTCKKCKCMTTDTRDKTIGLCFNCEHGLVYQKKEDDAMSATQVQLLEQLRIALEEADNGLSHTYGCASRVSGECTCIRSAVAEMLNDHFTEVSA